MDFGETLLAAQRNQQQKNPKNEFYRTKFEPPKKEQKPASRLSANIQKFLVKKEEEEKRKQDEARRKRDELLAMRDPKATRKIQKMLKVIKSANKSVLEEAVDTEHTAVTRTGADQPDQDDYGYESQEAAALYKKMMDKYSKMPEEEKFPASKCKVSKKDLDGTRERMRAALQREEEPQPRQRKSRTHHPEKEDSPPPQPEKKPEKPRIRRLAPPPIDFNQLLKLAEQKKDEPIAMLAPVNKVVEQQPERPMTKKQKKEFEEEMARREAKRRRLEGDSKTGSSKQDRARSDMEKKPETNFTRIPKIGGKSSSMKINKPQSESTKKAYIDERRPSPHHNIKKPVTSENQQKIDLKSQNTYRTQKVVSNKVPMKSNKDGDRIRSSFKEHSERNININGVRSSKEEKNKLYKQLDRRHSSKEDERERINKPDKKSKPSQPLDRNISRDQDRMKLKREENKNYSIRPDLKSKSDRATMKQTLSGIPDYKSAARKSDIKEKILAKEKQLFRSNSPVPKLDGSSRPQNNTKIIDNKPNEFSKLSKPLSVSNGKAKLPVSKPETKTFDFDKHVSSLKKGPDRNKGSGPSGTFPSGDVRRKHLPGDTRSSRLPSQKRRVVDSDSEYDSEMDDFIDDGDDNANYSAVIRDIFGYDKNKYRHLDEEDDAGMESSFAQQMREEYISKKIGIMEDLEDMRMEAMEKKKGNKRRRISDDDD